MKYGQIPTFIQLQMKYFYSVTQLNVSDHSKSIDMKFKLTCFSLLLSFITFAQTNNALRFNGLNNYVKLNQVPSMFNDIENQDFTIETWINPHAGSFSRVFFTQKDYSNFVSLTLSTDNRVYFYVVNNGRTWSTSTVNGLIFNQWQHIAVSWKADTKELNTYINGVAQNTSSGGTSSSGTNNTAVLGARSDLTSQFLNASLDEFKIWGKVKSQSEVANGMLVVDVDDPSLKLYYNFNQGTANGNNTTFTQLFDLKVPANNGTLTNFQLSGNNSNWIASPLNVVLPVKTGSFVLNKEANAVSIKWSTLTELDSDYFTISRSSDGKTFEHLKRVSAAGNSKQRLNYSYTDHTPYSGTNYYKLEQTDLDGKLYEIGIKDVNFKLDDLISIYPNPAVQNVYVKGNYKEFSEVQLLDVAGKVLQQKNISNLNEILSFNLDRYVKGIYFIRLRGTIELTKKVIKL